MVTIRTLAPAERRPVSRRSHSQAKTMRTSEMATAAACQGIARLTATPIPAPSKLASTRTADAASELRKPGCSTSTAETAAHIALGFPIQRNSSITATVAMTA